MSTPMFIREPVAGGSESVTNAWTEIISAVAEATLIEEITGVVTNVNQATDAGRLNVRMVSPTPISLQVGSYTVPAGAGLVGGGTEFATVRIAFGLTLPVGWSLEVIHDVQKTGGGGIANMHVVAHGGIVR